MVSVVLVPVKLVPVVPSVIAPPLVSKSVPLERVNAPALPSKVMFSRLRPVSTVTVPALDVLKVAVSVLVVPLVAPGAALPEGPPVGPQLVLFQFPAPPCHVSDAAKAVVLHSNASTAAKAVNWKICFTVSVKIKGVRVGNRLRPKFYYRFLRDDSFFFVFSREVLDGINGIIGKLTGSKAGFVAKDRRIAWIVMYSC